MLPSTVELAEELRHQETQYQSQQLPPNEYYNHASNKKCLPLLAGVQDPRIRATLLPVVPE